MDILAVKNAAQAGGANALRAPVATGGGSASARKTAEAFEAQFLGQMFQLAMRDQPVDSVFGGGAGERMFRDLLTDAWAEDTAKSGVLGISDAVMKTIIAAQEGQ